MVRSWKTNRPWMRLSAALLLLTGGGCGARRSDSLPANEAARGALETALKAWCDGGKPGALPGTSPVIQVNDTPWAQGDHLTSFEILKEEPSAAELKYSVRLTLTKPDRVQDVEYYVLGREPIMVFRDEDYRRNINMEDGPRLNQTRKPRGRNGR